MSADKNPSIFSLQMKAIVYVAKIDDFYVPVGKAIVTFSTSVFSKNLMTNHHKSCDRALLSRSEF